ncbi:collagen alpha-1(V) chain-like [Orycteropus afer afer]|uniref:Collagen alpha-1(V) chain-like n=1 Tax=Orycteropus afer afer TaxID=1230840 RepID=A0AC54ZF29_ORYAF|nr:collagen alpha-1(V) chain-like [Orycteropus afer afer]
MSVVLTHRASSVGRDDSIATAEDRIQCACASEQDLDETCVVQTDKECAVKKRVEHLVPAFLEGDLSYIYTFLGKYRTYATTQQALDLLFQWYGRNFPRSSGDGALQDQLKEAISFILFTWMAEYSEDFRQPPDFPSLKAVAKFLQANMPGSDVERRAHHLLVQLLRLKPAAAKPAAPKPRQISSMRVAQGPAAPPEPACGSPADGEPASAPTQDLHGAPGPPPPVQPLTPGGQTAEELGILPGSPPEGRQEEPGDVAPGREPTSELHRALDPLSPAPSLGPGGESAAELESLPCPSLEVNQEAPGDVDPASETTSESLGTPAPPLPAASQGTDGESARELDARPGPAQEANQEHLADGDLEPEEVSVHQRAPEAPSLAPSVGTDGEAAGELGVLPGQAPEADCNAHGDVDPDDETVAELPRAPDPPSLAPSLGTGGEAAGGLEILPGPLQEANQEPPGDVEPGPETTSELLKVQDPPTQTPSPAHDGEPVEEMDILPDTPPEANGDPHGGDPYGGVHPDDETTSEFLLLSLGTGGEPAGELATLLHPSPETNQELHGQVDPDPEIVELQRGSDPLSVAQSLATDGEPGGQMEILPGPLAKAKLEHYGDVESDPKTTLELHGAPDPPSPAPSLVTDGEPTTSKVHRAPDLPTPAPSQAAVAEPAGELDILLGPLPEGNREPHAYVGPDPQKTSGLHRGLEQPLPTPSLGTVGESAGGLGTIPASIPKENQGPSSDLDPAPLLMLGLHEALHAPSPNRAQAQEGEPCAAPSPQVIVLHREGACAPEADSVLPSPEWVFFGFC